MTETERNEKITFIIDGLIALGLDKDVLDKISDGTDLVSAIRQAAQERGLTDER